MKQFTPHFKTGFWGLWSKMVVFKQRKQVKSDKVNIYVFAARKLRTYEKIPTTRSDWIFSDKKFLNFWEIFR